MAHNLIYVNVYIEGMSKPTIGLSTFVGWQSDVALAAHTGKRRYL